MKYYTDEKGRYIAETDNGQKAVRGEELTEDYCVYYDYVYFVDDIVVMSDVCGSPRDLINDLISTGNKKVKFDSKVYRADFLFK